MLHIGSHGDPVKHLQRLLSRYDSGLAIDGAFGAHTERAVRQAQRKNAIYPPDGVAGPITLSVLEAQHPAPAHLPGSTGATKPQRPADHGNPGSLQPAVQKPREQAKHAPPTNDQPRAVSGMSTSDAGLRFIVRHECQSGVSNHLHHPSLGSGVTIGPGYDMKDRSPKEIADDLKRAAVDPAKAEIAARGSHSQR